METKKRSLRAVALGMVGFGGRTGEEWLDVLDTVKTYARRDPELAADLRRLVLTPRRRAT